MDYAGFVTAVDAILWNFTLDGLITVHIAHLKATGKGRLPKIGEKISLHKVFCDHPDRLHLFVSKRGEIWYHDESPTKEEDRFTFPELVNELKLGFEDLKKIHSNIKGIELFAKSLLDAPQRLAIAVAELLAKDNPEPLRNEKDALFNKILPNFSISTISDHRYVDVKKCGTDPKAPYWTFGSHFKPNFADRLLGFLHVKEAFGLPRLKDDRHTMFCIITGDSSGALSRLVNNFVLIKKYFVFTEMYNQAEQVPNAEYVLFDVGDVAVISSVNVCWEEAENSCDFLLENPGMTAGFSEVTSFVLLNKATISYADRTRRWECWLEVVPKSAKKPTFLCLNKCHFGIVPFFKPNCCYTVYHKKQLANLKPPFRNNFLKKLKPNNPQVEFAPDDFAIFTFDSRIEEETPLLTIPAALDAVEDDGESLVSFKGILKNREFIGSFAPHANLFTVQSGHKPASFGMPGKMKHKLIFEDRETDKILKLFVHNWDLLQTPLGLIPDMEIAVYNVVHSRSNSGIYFKPTPLTRIEVLGYKPLAVFQSCNLFSEDDWGQRSFLGYGNLIPTGVVIWSNPIKVKITSLTVDYDSQLQTVDNLKLKINMLVWDEMGKSFVTSNSPELLRLLLEFEPFQWKVFYEAFANIQSYVYSEDDEAPEIARDFSRDLTLQVLAVSTVRFGDALQLKCRKLRRASEYASANRRMRGNDNYFGGDSSGREELAMWFCIDARRV